MDRTRTVNARTRGFLSDGRKEDDGADKSAANLTRPFRFVGLWLSRGWNVVVGWLGRWLSVGGECGCKMVVRRFGSFHTLGERRSRSCYTSDLRLLGVIDGRTDSARAPIVSPSATPSPELGLDQTDGTRRRGRRRSFRRKRGRCGCARQRI